MQTIFHFLLRAVLVVAGLLFAASLLVVMTLLMALWGVRAVWARLTGQAFSPFEMRLDPRTGFRHVYRRGHGGAHGRASAGNGAGSPAPRRPAFGRLTDVTDVEPKASRS